MESFTYLGSSLSANANIDAALARLKGRVFRNKEIYTRTKMKVYKAIVLPTLLFGSETWTTYSRHLKLLEMFHMRSLRRILGVTWEQKRTNNSILDEAESTSIEAMIIKSQMRWAGHVTRMADCRLPKQILYSELEEGQRTRGGQRKRFKDVLKNNLKRCFIRTETWENRARSRGEWRKAICDGVEIFEERRREHREELRSARKHRQQTQTHQGTSLICPVCQKGCLSKIGLFSHMRTHR